MKKGSFVAGLCTLFLAGLTCSVASAQQVVQPTPKVTTQTVEVTPTATHSAGCGCASEGCASGGCATGSCESGCNSCESARTGILSEGRPVLFARLQCPSCDEGCFLEVKPGKTKKKVFETTSKTICIPRVRLPWRSACEPPTARTRKICVLKTKTIECPSCEYKWKVPEGFGCDTAAPLPKDAKNVIKEPTPAPKPKKKSVMQPKVQKTSARTTAPVQIVPIGTYRK